MVFNDYNNFFYYDHSSSKNNNTMDCGQDCELNWRTHGKIAEIIQPEANTTYTISDQIQRDGGKLLFIRWKAPAFPDTYHNTGIAGNEDMRYWSMSFITPGGLLGLSVYTWRFSGSY